MNEALSMLIGITICAMYLVGTVSLSDLVPAKAQDLNTNHSIIENLPVINQGTPSSQQTNTDKVEGIDFKIKGIDYSTKIAQMLVTIDGKTYANTFNPISLLDPHDDD